MCCIKKWCFLFYLLLTYYYWQSSEVSFLGECEGNIEPWNFCWCWAVGLLFHICFFCLPVQYIWYCKCLFAVIYFPYYLIYRVSILYFEFYFEKLLFLLLVLLYKNVWNDSRWIKFNAAAIFCVKIVSGMKLKHYRKVNCWVTIDY